MAADIESFEDALRARKEATPAHFPLTERYIRRAEEALKILAHMTEEADRRAVCEITETWLSLAEASLQPAARG